MEFITDRTYGDVQKAIEYEKRGWKNLNEEEQQEWNAGMKGAINDFDLNRMANNLINIQKELIKRNTSAIDWQIHHETDSYVYVDNFDYIYIVTDLSKVRIRVVYYTDANTVASQEYLTSNATMISKIGYAFVFVQVYYDTDYKDTYVGGLNKKFNFAISDARTDWKWDWQNPDSDWLPINALPPIINNVNSLKHLAYPTVGLDEISTDLNGFDFQRANEIEKYSELMHNFATSEMWAIDVEWKSGYTINDSGKEIKDSNNHSILTADYIKTIPAPFKIKARIGTHIKIYKYNTKSTYSVIYEGVKKLIATGDFQSINPNCDLIKIYADTKASIEITI